jgi:hypothetical protein
MLVYASNSHIETRQLLRLKGVKGRGREARAPLGDHWKSTGPAPRCSFDISKSCFISPQYTRAPPAVDPRRYLSSALETLLTQ